MGCSSPPIDYVRQNTTPKNDYSFARSNILLNSDLQLNELPAPEFENIKPQEVVVTSQQSKLLQIVGKLKNKVDFNRYYLVKASLLSFSNNSVMPQIPPRMYDFAQEMEEKNFRLQQVENDQDMLFYQNLHNENRRIKTRGAARQSMKSVDDTVESVLYVQQHDVETSDKMQSDQIFQEEILTTDQENIKLLLEKQKQEDEQQFADLNKLDEIENQNLYQKHTILNEQVIQRYFKIGQYICDPVEDESELYSEEIKEHRFVNQSNVQYVREIVTAKLIELIASGAKSGKIRIGCSLGYQIIWDIKDSAVALAEKASNAEITASCSGSSSTCGSSTQRWAIIECSEIISDVDPEFVKVENTLPGINDQPGITYDRLKFNKNALIKFVPHCYRHFTSLLNSEELVALQQIIYGLELMKSKVNLLEPVSKPSWDKIWKCIIYDFPELFYSVATPYYSNDAGYVYKLSLNYNEPADSILEKQYKLNEISQNILSPIIQNIQSLSQFDIELIICDYLVHNISYDLKSSHNQQVEGGLLDKRCVCAGYSRSFLFLAQHINLPSLYVSGWAKKPTESQGEGHAWNKLYLNQNWYSLDVTWTSESEAGYCYFNFSDTYAGRSRKEDSEHIYPACILMDQFYYVHNKMYVNQQNVNEIQQLTFDYAMQQIKNNSIDFNIVLFIDFQTRLFDFSQELQFGLAKAASRCSATIKDSQVSSSGDNALILKVSLYASKFQEFEEMIPDFSKYCFSSRLRQRNILKFSKNAAIQFKPETFRYHVDLLTENELASLQDIVKCLEIGVSTVNLLQFCSYDEMKRIHHCLEYDFTEYIYSLSYSSYCKDGNIYKLQFSVLPNPEQIKLEQVLLENAMQPLVEQVRTCKLNEIETEILIAQWIADNISKSNSKSSSFPETAYGIFVDQMYSWLGIHEAFTYAMQCFGIPCITISNAKGYYNLVYVNNDWRTVNLNDQLYNPFELNTIDKLNSIYVPSTLFHYPQTQSMSVNHAKLLNILISSETEHQLCQIIIKLLSQQIQNNKIPFVQYIYFDYEAQINSLCQVAWTAISSVKNSYSMVNISLSTGVNCFIFRVQ